MNILHILNYVMSTLVLHLVTYKLLNSVKSLLIQSILLKPLHTTFSWDEYTVVSKNTFSRSQNLKIWCDQAFMEWTSVGARSFRLSIEDMNRWFNNNSDFIFSFSYWNNENIWIVSFLMMNIEDVISQFSKSLVNTEPSNMNISSLNDILITTNPQDHTTVTFFRIKTPFEAK